MWGLLGKAEKIESKNPPLKIQRISFHYFYEKSKKETIERLIHMFKTSHVRAHALVSAVSIV